MKEITARVLIVFNKERTKALQHAAGHQDLLTNILQHLLLHS